MTGKLIAHKFGEFPDKDTGEMISYDKFIVMGNKQISVDGKIAVIEGVNELVGAPVKATDLRAGAAMVIGGLAARGVTQVEEIEHIERGYENIVEKFQALGADIQRVSVADKVSAKAAL